MKHTKVLALIMLTAMLGSMVQANAMNKTYGPRTFQFKIDLPEESKKEVTPITLKTGEKKFPVQLILKFTLKDNSKKILKLWDGEKKLVLFPIKKIKDIEASVFTPYETKQERISLNKEKLLSDDDLIIKYNPFDQAVQLTIEK